MRQEYGADDLWRTRHDACQFSAIARVVPRSEIEGLVYQALAIANLATIIRQEDTIRRLAHPDFRKIAKITRAWNKYSFYTKYLFISAGIDRNNAIPVSCAYQIINDDPQFTFSWKTKGEDEIAEVKVSPFHKKTPDAQPSYQVEAFTRRCVTSGLPEDNSGDSIDRFKAEISKANRFWSFHVTEELTELMEEEASKQNLLSATG